MLAFVQAILDSSLLSLLSYPPAHQVLRDILQSVQPELEWTDEVEQLRMPLEPFIKEHAKLVHEAAHGPPKADPAADWRRKRKEAHEQVAVAVGVYQMEELTI